MQQTFHNKSNTWKPQNTWYKPQSGVSRPQVWGAKPTSSAAKPGGFYKKPVGTAPRIVSSKPHFVSSRAPMTYINEQIKAPTIMIIWEDGASIGTFPRKKALEMAEQEGLDIVQVRYDQESMVSTVKMVDYGKYMYQKQKDDKEKKKTQKPSVLKEMKLNYAIGDNDLQLKIKKTREMLQDWYNVRCFIKLKWREKAYFTKAIEKLLFIKDQLSDISRSQSDHPKQEVQWYSIVLFSK